MAEENQVVRDDEISLREIIDVLWSGKWLIALVTAIAVFLSGIVSFFVMDPVYEPKYRLTINSYSPGSGLDNYLNEQVSPQIYMAYLKSPAFLQQVIEKQNLDPEEWPISRLQENLQINYNPEESNVMTLSMSGSDAEKMTDLLNFIAEESQVFTANKIQTQLDRRLSQLEANMDEEQQNLNQAIEEYNELKAGSGLPTLILFQQTASNSQYVLETNQELLEELRGLEKEDEIQYKKINQEINKLTSMYNQYFSKYQNVRSVDSTEYVNNKVQVVAQAFVPENPVSPNKILNVAVAFVVGAMAGVFVVFLRSYLNNTTHSKETTIKG